VPNRHQKSQSTGFAQFGPSSVRIFAINERMNQFLIEHLNPGRHGSQTARQSRAIAAIFTTCTTFARSGYGSPPRI